MKKVLILGGGFAGVEAAIYLKKNKFDVTLISNREYLYVYPTSIWIPTGKKSFEDTCIPLADLQNAHNFELIIDEVTNVDAKSKTVTCKNSTHDGYDYLVLAMGLGKVKHDGVENAPSICGKPEESLTIKEQLNTLVEKGSGKIAMGFGGNPKDTSAVRGGPAFELMFNVHNFLKKKGIRDNFELTFFAPMEKPGAKMGEKALKMMDIFFTKLNINKHFGKKIKAFVPDGVIFADDTKLESDMTMFIAAGAGNPVLTNAGVTLSDAGFVKINNYCEVEINGEIDSSVFAIGDSAALEGPQWRAKQGHVAEVMAKNVANNILFQETGKGEKSGYIDHLNILCVMDSGDGAAFVYRDDKRGFMIPMPWIGHMLKRGWGWYYKNSKLGKIPRIPGM